MVDMCKTVIKRDGREVPFELKKIEDAIRKAVVAAGESLHEDDLGGRLVETVILLAETKAQDPTHVPVETIQDAVEEVLMRLGYTKIAKAFILYRAQHTAMRDVAAAVNIGVVDDYLGQMDWRVKENSNMAYSLQGLNNHISSEVSKVYWLQKLYAPAVRDAHVGGDMHIHDLGVLGPYCVGWDLYDLLKLGFKGVPGKVESAPAKHFRTALGQVSNFVFSMQGECYDAATEVLTDSGWKLFSTLTETDLVATMNRTTRTLEFKRPTARQCYAVDTELVQFKNSKLDLLVTKGHNMLVEQYSPGTPCGKGKLKLVRADKFNPSTNMLPNRATWQGEERNTFQLPAYTTQVYSGYTKTWRTHTYAAKPIAMDAWLPFLGIFIAEGSTYSRTDTDPRRDKPRAEYTVCISQAKFVAEVGQIVDNFSKASGIRFSLTKTADGMHGFRCSDVQLYTYLVAAVGAGSHSKRIPREYLGLCSRQLNLLYRAMVLGDGDSTEYGNHNYYTASDELANDILELLPRIGRMGAIRKRSVRRDGKLYTWNVVAEHRTATKKLNAASIRSVPYSGFVYCATTDNGTLLVRRNGIAAWCGNCAGAQAFSSFDTFLAPFIRYDRLDQAGVKQAIQEFVFNMNVATRTGFQTPFSNITMDLQAPKSLCARQVLIGGKEMPEGYGDFQVEMDMLNQAFLEVMTEGDAKGRVFTFPIPTYNITKSFDWDRPGLDRLWEVTAKYGIPYFSNFVNSDMDPDESRSMCCRLRLDKRELLQRGGGLFGAAEKTGSLGVVTINLPRLGYLATDKADFLKRLDALLLLAKESLEVKRKVLERFTDQGLYPYIKFYLKSVKESSGKYWRNHFSTVGLVGMNEACMNLFDSGTGIASAQGKAFAEEVLTFMRMRLADFQEETGNLYNLEATPAEGTSYRLAKIDKKRFGAGFITAGGDGEVYFTNSSQLPVGHTNDIFEALDHQDSLQTKYSGGTVVHAFVGESVSDPASVKAFVKTVCENYKLPYFTLTPTFSVCDDCGFISGEHSTCPKCGKSAEVYSRIVGYIRPVQQWNSGKKHEFEQRVTFTNV